MFHTIIYDPLYNALVALLSLFPHFDVGIAVIIFTVAIKLLLFPLSRKSVRTQMALKKVQPEIDAVKEQYKDNKQELALKTMEIYKKHKINPISGVFLTLIQLPILIALYLIFARSGLPVINQALLYSFVHAPVGVSMLFLGLVNIALPSPILGAIAAISQHISARLSIPPAKTKTEDGKKGSFAEDFAQSMGMQAKYVFPLIVFGISFTVSGALSLYWIVSNLFTIGQELYLREPKQQQEL